MVTELLFKELLDFYFGRLKKLDNYRPVWLEGLELDRYYPEIRVGLEFQGIQHYRPSKPLKTSREDFFNQLKRDTEKVRLCEKEGVKLFQLGLYDLTPERLKGNFKKIAKVGMANAQRFGDKRVFEHLNSIRWDRELPPGIRQRLEGIYKSKKWRA